MPAPYLLLSVFAAVQILLLVWAGRALARASVYTSGQRAAQFGLAACIPLLGALLVVFMARDAIEAFPPRSTSFSTPED